MPARNTITRYGTVAQALHWTIVLLLLVQYTLAWIAHELPLSPEKLGVLARHKSFGITILTLMAVRLVWRTIDSPPPLPPLPRWQTFAARLSHALLYGLLVALPLTGWLMSSAANYPVSWFGLVQLPDLVAPDPALKDTLRSVHKLLGIMLATIAGLHVCAALKHQFFDGDGLLYRMLPWRARS